ncbi:hypothetical protein J4230_00015 [Candidatus Woesearchaeota archaeon]|nr:hypothetical protein [Candidatus Woesearchaeota archaeon]
MVDMTVIEQKPLLMADVKEKLSNIKKETKELNFRAERVYVYLDEFANVKKKDADALYKKLSGLGLQRLKDKYIVKIIDTMPEDIELLKSLFAGEALSLKQDEIKQVLDALQS